MEMIRWLDKLIDELAKVKAMPKILREEAAPETAGNAAKGGKPARSGKPVGAARRTKTRAT